MKNIKLHVSSNIEELVPYPPGKPIEEVERELGLKPIKLASNENPLGPSPKAVEAIKGALAGLNRYPDGSCFYLKRKLSERLGVPEECLIFGNGSNEIIELLVRTFVREGEHVVMAEPSFAVYPLVVKAAGGVAVKVALDGELRISLKAMAEAVTDKTRLVFIANPNNPTGTIVRKDELRGFLDSLPEDVIVCLDEAYYEYVQDEDFPNSIEYVKEGRAVVVMRTFSKIYGLAGLRIGYGVGHPKIVDYLGRVRQPFNVNSLAQVASLAALDDTEHITRSRENNIRGLEYLYGELEKMGYSFVRTEANFFLIRVGDGEGFYRRLLEKGVIVRAMKGFGLEEYIRVTVGTEEENRRFIDALRAVTEEYKEREGSHL